LAPPAPLAVASTMRADRRARSDRLLFSGPATALLLLFYVPPVLVDLVIAFTDMSRNLQVAHFTTENVERMLGGDRRLSQVLANTLVCVLCTLALFDVG